MIYSLLTFKVLVLSERESHRYYDYDYELAKQFHLLPNFQ